MRAVILGGCGAMGSEATRDLAVTSDFDEITIADLDKEKASALLTHSRGDMRGSFDCAAKRAEEICSIFVKMEACRE
jgi:saccharopine dehydrogenase-like NADP-dependent oxidoreductase